jgi:hypothetical protein
LNFNTTEISVYSPNKEAYSPVVANWSTIGSVISQDVTLYNYETYYGPLFAGSPLQTPTPNNYLLYATQESMSYIPTTAVSTIGWYDISTSTSAV